MRNKYKIFLVVMLFVLLCGCSANREIDEQSIVSSVAFDWDKKVGVTVEVLSVSIDEQNISTRIFYADGDTIDEAFKNLNNKLPKRLLFDHCAAIILSSEMDNGRQEKILDYCIDEPTVNLSTPVVYTDNINELLFCSHESAAVGYDIMQILRHIDKEKQSRLYKTAVDTEKILTFGGENGKVVRK